MISALPATSPGQQAFAPNEQVVSLQPDLIDFEFSKSRSMIVWADSTGKLWTAKVDPTSGQFIPTNGKGTLVDGDALASVDLGITYNGPEWISAASGDQIVYTKFLAGLPHTAATARLALATQNADGTWAPVMMGPNAPRIGPYASQDPGDPTPRITYVDALGKHYWRYINSSGVEATIPGLPPSVVSVRFVEGAKAVVFSTPAADGVKQVYYYGLGAAAAKQLTFDAGNKDLQTVPWAWKAPELNNELLVMTVVENTLLRFYRKDGSGNWQVYSEVAIPSGMRVSSPEPFTYNGKSYVSMTLGLPADTYPSQIWIAGVDPAAPLLRQVSSSEGSPRARIDPEVYATTRGVYVYYNRFNPAKDPGNPFCGPCSEGVFRANTGLAP